MKSAIILVGISGFLSLAVAAISVNSGIPPASMIVSICLVSFLCSLLCVALLLRGTRTSTVSREENPVQPPVACPDPVQLAKDLDSVISRASRLEQLIGTISEAVVSNSHIHIPLADSIINAVPAKTEEAAFTVIDKFMVVKEASSRAASEARELRLELEDSSSSQSIRAIAENTRSALVTERGVIEGLRVCTRENQIHIKAMGSEIDSGLELLDNINDITERSKLIAFNMSIEAARIGEKGRGFKVIITELHKLNQRTLEFSSQVASLLSRFRDYNRLMHENMQDKADAVIVQVERGMRTTEEAVERLIGASTKTEEFTRRIAAMSESINKDLEGVLESLQFQDITRQMIEGARIILAEVKESLDSCLKSGELPVNRETIRDRFVQTKKRFIAQAKTKGEKEALMEVQL